MDVLKQSRSNFQGRIQTIWCLQLKKKYRNKYLGLANKISNLSQRNNDNFMKLCLIHAYFSSSRAYKCLYLLCAIGSC